MYGSHISVLVHCNRVYIKCNIVPNVFYNPIRTMKKIYITDTLYEQNR